MCSKYRFSQSFKYTIYIHVLGSAYWFCFPVACENKHTDSSECDKWAAEGECQINPVWMPENCRKSCHMCGDSGKIVTTPEPTPEPGMLNYILSLKSTAAF